MEGAEALYILRSEHFFWKKSPSSGILYSNKVHTSVYWVTFSAKKIVIVSGLYINLKMLFPLRS